MVRAARITPGSIADELGIVAGTELKSVSGRPLRDFLDWEFLTAEDAFEASNLPFKEGLALLAEKYPRGFLVDNGRGFSGLAGEVPDARAAVDPRAVLNFTAGSLDADDVIGISLWQVLQSKKALWLALKDDTAGDKGLAQARQDLGQHIRWLISAVNGLAVTGAVLKRLSCGKRDCALITARTYDHIPTEEVWMSEETAFEAGLEDGESVIIGRHPTALFFKAKCIIHDELPYSVVAISSLAMNVTNKGDTDGDQVWVIAASKAAVLYSSNTHERELASRLICMMAWNAGVEVQATPRGHFKAYDTESIPFVDLWKARWADYTRHQHASKSPFAKSVAPGDTLPRIKPPVWFDSSVYDKTARFGTAGIGTMYGGTHNAYVIAQYVQGETDAESVMLRHAFRAAFQLGQDLYEDVALAGYTADRWEVYAPLEKPIQRFEMADKVVALSEALALNGMTAKTRGLSGETVLRNLAICRNMQAAFATGKGELFGYEWALPVCKALRGLSSGDKNMIVTPEEWEQVVELTTEANPFFEIVGSIADVYRLLALIHEMQKQRRAELFD